MSRLEVGSDQQAASALYRISIGALSADAPGGGTVGVSAALLGVGYANGLPFPDVLVLDFSDTEQDTGNHVSDRAAQIDLLRDGHHPYPALAPVGQHVNAF